MITTTPDHSPVEPPKRMMSVTYINGCHYVHINSSSLNVIQACPKKAYYVLNRHLVPHEKSTAITFGTAIHKALEIYYAEPRDKRTYPPDYKKNIMLMCHGQQLQDESTSFIYRATRGFIDEAGPLAGLADTDKRSLSNGGWLLGEYFESRKDDPYEVVVADGVPLVEQLLEHMVYDTPELKITLFGTIDAILVNKSNGQILVCDHKTSSMVGNAFYNRTKPNHQYTAYIHLAQQALGYTTENFMINCFEVKARPKTTRGKGPNFLHLITKRTPHDIEEFVKTLTYYVRQYISWTETNYWPYGPVDACANYGSCTFLDVCQTPEEIKENIIACNYKDTRDEKTQ